MWSTPLGIHGQCDIRRRKRIIRIRKWHYNGAMQGCRLTSLVACINDEFRDIRERKMTIKNEIWTTHICSLGIQDFREWVALWGVDITEFRVYRGWHYGGMSRVSLLHQTVKHVAATWHLGCPPTHDSHNYRCPLPTQLSWFRSALR